MFFLPYATVLLWLSLVFIIKLQPDVTYNINITGPAIVLISVLLPTCFWILLEKAKTIFSLVMILLFSMNLGWFGFDLISKYQMVDKLSSYTEGIDPDWVRMVSDRENGEERENVARAIFQKHGVKIAYRAENEDYLLYTPTTDDRNNILNNIDRKNSQIILKRNLKYEVMTDAFLIALQVIIFLLVFVYLAFSSKRRDYSGDHSN